MSFLISKRLIALVLALGLGGAVACGGDDAPRPESASPTTSLTTTPRPLATSTGSDARLANALLTADDLGGGWRQQSVEGAGVTAAENDYCGTKVRSFAFDAVALFDDPARPGLLMFEAFSRFDSATAAQAAFDELNAAQASCSDWTSSDGVRSTVWRTASFDSVGLGDQSLIEKATSQIEGAGGVSQVVAVVRRGDTILSIAELASGDLAIAEGLDIATKAMSKYEATIAE